MSSPAQALIEYGLLVLASSASFMLVMLGWIFGGVLGGVAVAGVLVMLLSFVWLKSS